MQNKKYTLYSFCFLFCLWQLASLLEGNSIFFPSFWEVLKEGVALLEEREFWRTLLFSLFRVGMGFLFSLFLALFLALFAYWKDGIEILWKGLFRVFQILPSLVLILLLLVFCPTERLAFFIQLCVVLPLLYEQFHKTLMSLGEEYGLCLYYYEVSFWKRIAHIYFPFLWRELSKNIAGVLGLAFKVTIAGELIAQEDGTIGGEIFLQKMYLNIPRMFAWCMLLLLLHVIFLLLFALVMKVPKRKWKLRRESLYQKRRKEVYPSISKKESYSFSFSHRYGREEIYKHLQLSIIRGEKVGFWGLSACGKTTLLKELAKKLRAEGAKISYIFQHEILFEWLTVEENIFLVLQEVDWEKYDEIFRLLRLEEHKEKYPSELSGGLRKRLAFARAILYEGDYLFLDEAFEFLDKAMQEEILEYLERNYHWKEKTLFMVTHRMEIMTRLVERVYFFPQEKPIESLDMFYSKEKEKMKERLEEETLCHI